MGGEYIIVLGFSILTILVLCFFYAIIFNLKTKPKNENSNTNSFENNIDDEEIEIVILDEEEEEVDDNISKKIKKARNENEKQ
jgi:hypothetical protein